MSKLCNLEVQNNNLIGTPTNKFEFEDVTLDTVKKAMSNLNATSSPGINEIPTKIFKMCIDSLAHILVDLFNSCFAQKEILLVWKSFRFSEIFSENSLG